MADVRHITHTCGGGFGTCTATCPVGYVVISTGYVCGYESNDGSGNSPIYASVVGSVNPTSMTAPNSCRNISMVCAKVCN